MGGSVQHLLLDRPDDVIAGVIMMQILPFADRQALKAYRQFERGFVARLRQLETSHRAGCFSLLLITAVTATSEREQRLFQHRPSHAAEHHLDRAGVAVCADDDQIHAVICGLKAMMSATLLHQCGAHLAGIHVVFSGSPGISIRLLHVIGEKAIRALLAERKTADEAATSNVRRRFEAISAKRDLSAEFRVIRRGGPDEDITLSSLHSDLVVIGQRELQELRGSLSPEKLLLASGAPILVVPIGWKSETIGNKILVGWNASREARRRGRGRTPVPRRGQLRDASGCRFGRESSAGTAGSPALISPSIWRGTGSASKWSRCCRKVFCGCRHHPFPSRRSRRGSDRHWRLQPCPLRGDDVRRRNPDVAETGACSRS